MKTVWKIIILIFCLAIICGILALIFDWGRRDDVQVSDNNQDQATTSDIVIFTPKTNDAVTSPIEISGKAKGNWFFEAVFPVKLVDENENVIGTGQAHAESDWTTNDFVNFSAEITYDNSTSTDNGVLVFSNDNPSGNPDTLKSIYIPVKLK